tara:strand:+ start:2576 stop:3157 length:582 start_codon:yes stop_codon:yes gene_type:complete
MSGFNFGSKMSFPKGRNTQNPNDTKDAKEFMNNPRYQNPQKDPIESKAFKLSIHYQNELKQLKNKLNQNEANIKLKLSIKNNRTKYNELIGLREYCTQYLLIFENEKEKNEYRHINFLNRLIIFVSGNDSGGVPDSIVEKMPEVKQKTLVKPVKKKVAVAEINRGGSKRKTRRTIKRSKSKILKTKRLKIIKK